MSKSDPTLEAGTSPEVPQAAAPLNQVLDFAGKLVGLSSLLGALLFYYGWVQTGAFYQFFGVEQSALGFSSQDYLLRSIVVAWQLIRWLLVGALAAGLGDLILVAWLRRSSVAYDKWRRILVVSAGGLGLVLVAANLVATWMGAAWPMPAMFYPITWTAGIGLAGYAFHLATLPRPRLPEDPSPISGKTKGSSGESAPNGGTTRREEDAALWARARRMGIWILIGLLVASLFWIVSISAGERGLLRARQVATYLEWEPDVILYSDESLDLEGPGITFEIRCQNPGTCKVRYAGLKFLVRSDEKYFLLPAGWSPEEPLTIVLPDDGSIRVEFAPGLTPDLTP